METSLGADPLSLPHTFLNSFFSFEDWGKLSTTGSLHAPCTKKQPRETMPATGQQHSNVKEIVDNFKFICKHEKIPLLSVQATLH